MAKRQKKKRNKKRSSGSLDNSLTKEDIAFGKTKMRIFIGIILLGALIIVYNYSK